MKTGADHSRRSGLIAYNSGRPTLYIGKDPESEQAARLLKEAGFDVDIRPAPIHYHAFYGIPVLFGLFNKFEGLSGVKVFMKNAVFLGTNK